MAHRVLVLGAGYSGLVTALRLARRVRPEEVTVTLVSASPEFCERPRMHQIAVGQPVRRVPLSRYTEGNPVRLTVGHVTAVDTTGRAVTVSLPDKTVRLLGYDTLVYALGSAIDTQQVPGVAEHAHRLDDLDAAGRLHSALRRADAGEPRRVVVCGGGMTGIESAAEVAESHPSVQVELASRTAPGAWLTGRAQRYLASVLADLGVAVRAGVAVEEVGADHVRLADGTELPADACVWAGGFTVPTLARDAGLAVDAAGRARVDRTLRSVSHPDVYAVGDAAAVSGAWGESLAMGCRTGGFTGPAAADAIAARLTGRRPRDLRFRYIHECISLGRRRGLVQFLGAHGTPKNRVLTGRAAVAYKNATLNAAHLLFRWPGPYLARRRRALAATATDLTVVG